jgi:ssRNA-specific RNase YbeY (16S rRNA maturation enzyme)
VTFHNGAINTRERGKTVKTNTISFSIKKAEQGLAKSLRKYAKDKDMNISEAIKSILRKRLSRAGYEV